MKRCITPTLLEALQVSGKKTKGNVAQHADHADAQLVPQTAFAHDVPFHAARAHAVVNAVNDAAAHGRVLVPQGSAQESQQVPAAHSAVAPLHSSMGLVVAQPAAAPTAAPAAAPTAAPTAIPQTEAPKAPHVLAHVAKKKRRITPQSTASLVPAAGEAATHPAPAREPAIERTPEQYLAEVQRDAETIADAMSRFQSMTKTEMLYDNGADLESVGVLVQRMSTNMTMFRVLHHARRCKEQQAEEERRKTVKPVPIDQGETEIYDKYQSKLTGGNKILYKCRLAGANCICTLGPSPAGPGLKAIVQRHIDRVHCQTSNRRAELHGLGKAIAEGWVV